MDLSIIIPVYNVEKYIRPCIESIFRQSLDEKRFDVIIVNDGSTDNSMGRIDDRYVRMAIYYVCNCFHAGVS